MSASLADQLHAIHAAPTPEALANLPRIAMEVARLECSLDEIADDDREQAQLAEAAAAHLALLRRQSRNPQRLVVLMRDASVSTVSGALG